MCDIVKVVIIVKGGVAYVAEKSKGVILEIKDYDNDESFGDPKIETYSQETYGYSDEIYSK